MGMQERIHQDAVHDTNPTWWPEGTYDWELVYDDAYSANARSLLAKHLSVIMAVQLLCAINRPMAGIVVTLGDNFRMPVLTNQRHMWRGWGDEEDDWMEPSI
jgi:hypothetical protein